MLRALTVVVLLAAVLAACSREDEPQLPAACRSGPGALREALVNVPGPVRIDGETSVSDCLANAHDAADVSEIGATVVAVGSELERPALENPRGVEARRLGYLVGAARKGAERVPGFHYDMLRRLEQDHRPLEQDSPQYRRGLREGKKNG